MKNLKPFLGHQFSSNTYIEEDFVSFSRKFRNYIKKSLPEGYTLHYYNRGHYYVSGVIKDNQERFIYFSIPDVRYFRNEWYKDVLIRTMKHEKDWSGGINQRSTLEDFGKNIQKLY